MSVLQCLHSSPELNEQAKNLFTNIDDKKIESVIKSNNIFDILILPVTIYAQLDYTSSEDRIKTYELLQYYLSLLASNIVSENANNGYYPNKLMCYFMLPVIFKLFPKSFDKILKELQIDTIEFNKADYVIHDLIIGEKTFLKNTEHKELILKEYNEMLQVIPEIMNLDSFCCQTLSIRTNKNKSEGVDYGGHAVTLIYGSSDEEPTIKHYFVIDDQNDISILSLYYLHRNERIYELSIRNVNKKVINEINDIFKRECKVDDQFNRFENRVYRYVLIFEHSFDAKATNYELKESKTIQSVLKNETPKNMRVSGGFNNKVHSFNNYVLMFMLLLAIVVIIIQCLRIHKRLNETYTMSSSEISKTD